MKKILKSGRGYIKRTDDIVMYPMSLGQEKAIKSPNLDDIWKEMKWLDTRYESQKEELFHLFEANNLVFQLGEGEWDDYQLASRNVQQLALHTEKNPFQVYQQIISQRVLIIGLGTVGSSLVETLIKYGFKDISIVDGDVVEASNITAQLTYGFNDVGKYKSLVISNKYSSINKSFCDYVTENSISKIMAEVAPDIVFCCADDSTGKLYELLISKILDYEYRLLISGYLQDELIVHNVTKSNREIFLHNFKQDLKIEKSDFITHNTGTISKGMMSASLILNVFLNGIEEYMGDSFYFNTYSFRSFVEKVSYLNLNEYDVKYIYRNLEKELFRIMYELNNDLNDSEKENLKERLFSYSYYTYLKYSVNTKDVHYKYLYNLTETLKEKLFASDREDLRVSSRKDTKKHVEKFEVFKNLYYDKEGHISNQYLKNRNNLTSLERTLEKYKKFIFSDTFISKYNNLLKERRKYFKSLPEVLCENYNLNFINEIINSLSAKVNTKGMDKFDFLKIEFIDIPFISISQGFEKIFKALDCKEFQKFVQNYQKAGFIDFEGRVNKIDKNFTLFNPYTKTSKIVMSYDENIFGLLCLTHELSHAYIFHLFRNRLDIDTMQYIPKIFWEVLAKIVELYYLKFENKLSLFFRQSFYQLVFCIIDYKALSLERDYTLEDILTIKDEFVSDIGIDPELLEFTRYHFVNYRMLYSQTLSAYDYVFSDIITYSIFQICEIRGVNFEQFIKEITTLEELSMSSLYQLFHLDLKESVENYTSEINCFIEKEFLEELIHETFA